MLSAVFALRRYHEATKHSRRSVATSRHWLDWSNKPLPFKVHTTLEPIAPPEDLGRLCLYSNGVLRWRRHPSGRPKIERGSGSAGPSESTSPEQARAEGRVLERDYGFRAAACTGALYHVEIYLATAERSDLPAGLYHYSAHDHALRRLRGGDVRGALVDATGGYGPVAAAPVVLALTSTFWRNAWKYQARAYRHAFWDSGVILANLLGLTAASGDVTSIVMGFADDAVNRLVGVDGVREAAVALVAVGDGAVSPPNTGPLDKIEFPTAPLSPREVRYPEIEDAHRSSSLADGDAVAAWRAKASSDQAGSATGARDAGGFVPPRYASPSGAGAAPSPRPSSDRPIEEVIRARRSARDFADGPITRSQLAAALEAAMAPVAGDAFGTALIDPFVIVNAVEGLERGTYWGDLTPIRIGDFRRGAGELALGQPLGAEAAANVYFLSDLDAVFERFGERGYRAAQLAGAIAGGRLELAATAAGLGATGLTFFDDEVTEFFEPAADGRQVMYLAALGDRG